MKRDQSVETFFDLAGFLLKIGPRYNPLVPKINGDQIKILDHTNQEGLLSKYHYEPAAARERIEPVDYVSDGRSMVEVIGETERYDYIIAGHVIEHAPNMLG